VRSQEASHLGARHKIVQFSVNCSLCYSLHSPGITSRLQAYHDAFTLCQSRLQRCQACQVHDLQTLPGQVSCSRRAHMRNSAERQVSAGRCSLEPQRRRMLRACTFWAWKHDTCHVFLPGEESRNTHSSMLILKLIQNRGGVKGHTFAMRTRPGTLAAIHRWRKKRW